MIREGEPEVTLKFLAKNPRRTLAINHFTEGTYGMTTATRAETIAWTMRNAAPDHCTDEQAQLTRDQCKPREETYATTQSTCSVAPSSILRPRWTMSEPERAGLSG